MANRRNQTMLYCGLFIYLLQPSINLLRKSIFDCNLCWSGEICLFFQWYRLSTFEPRHDRTNKMSVHLAKIQISLGINKSVHPAKTRISLGGSDLSLCWVHTRFVGFVMSRLISHLLDTYSKNSDRKIFDCTEYIPEYHCPMSKCLFC